MDINAGRYFYRQGIGYLLEIGDTKGLGLELCHFGDDYDGHASLHILTPLGTMFIRLPRFFYWNNSNREMMDRWGFIWTWNYGERGKCIHLNWGDKYKILDMPWAMDHIRHDVLMNDGTWRRVNNLEYYEKWPNRFVEEYDYTYTLESGEVQHRKAKVSVEEREWRWKCFKWWPSYIIFPFVKTVRRCIDVEFNDEVGEKTGSWKGGCIGCGYEMKKIYKTELYVYNSYEYETPLECLRRMEKERKF